MFLSAAAPLVYRTIGLGWSPVYPCHVPPREVQPASGHRPIQTGRLQTERSNQGHEKSGILEEGSALLDGIDYTIIRTRRHGCWHLSSAVRHDHSYNLTIPLMRDIPDQAPPVIAEATPPMSRAI
jgi:hypothetical protein